jgi:hypothetical protein
MKHPDDGKFVVVQDGQRVSGELHETQGAAQTEADKAKAQRPVTEGGQQPEGPKVVQNLYG